MTTEQENELQKIGKNAMACIREMTDALTCDRERLEELRDERDAFEIDEDENAAPDGPGYANDAEAWASENPDDAEELKQLEDACKIDGEEVDEETAREEYVVTGDDHESLMTYVRCFYFGD